MERKRKLEIYESSAGAIDDSKTEDGDNKYNPYNGRPYSKRYFEILAGRKGTYTANLIFKHI